MLSRVGKLSGAVFIFAGWSGLIWIGSSAIGVAEANELQACVTCHGMNGNSADIRYPKLAGQRVSYLVDQLRAIREGRRDTPDSSAHSGTEESKFREFAEYFAAQEPDPGTPEKPELIPIGKEIYYRGIAAKSVPACATCHGLDGGGTRNGPRLASQHSNYIARQLQWFRDGLRRDSASMSVVARSMSDEEMDAVANFASSL